MTKNDNSLSSAVAGLRVSYSLASLGLADADPDPFRQFHRWLEEAIAADVPEANAMTLATVGADGAPSSRTVLLKAVDAAGLTFFTNYQSRKAREMAGNPRISVTFLWKELQRQVSVEGTVGKTTREESEAYFHSRPRSHQIGAWVSAQSTRIPGRAWMEEREHAFQAKFPEAGPPVPLPDAWGGYRLLPSAFEFWQGRASRLHDRIHYARSPDGTWERFRLSP